MSKHSKWAKVKQYKGAIDAKRGQIFTKLARNITVAAREGGADANFNFKLRMAIEKAKSANMPKDNIDRAIAKGVGGGEGAALRELVYEAFGPAGSAFVITALSDNSNRTAGEVKNILSKNGGTLAGQGAVMWQFGKLGIIRTSKDLGLKIKDKELELIDAGAEDIKYEEDGVIIFTKPENLQKVKEVLDKENITAESADIEYVAKEPKEATDAEWEKIESLIDAIDENDDVDEIYTNVK